MKTKNTLWIVVILALVVVVLGGAYHLLTKGTPAPVVTGTATTTTPAQPAAPQKLSMTNGVSVEYSVDTYGLAVNAQQEPKTVVPPCEQGFDYCFYRLGTQYANTNFESAGVGIKLRTDLKTEKTCLTTNPDGYTNLVGTTTKATGYSTSVFSPLSDAGAGHYSKGAQYRLWSGTTCTQFTTRIGETQFANYPAGTKTEFSVTDEKNVTDELNAFLRSVQLNGAKVQFSGI